MAWGGQWQQGPWSGGGGGGGELLWDAISQAVASMIHLESEWEAPKLEKKLRDYFNKGAKGMTFKGSLDEVINEYADNVLSSVFAGLGDRQWLYGGQVDFLLILDAGIKDTFPSYLLRNVAQADFEQMVLAAYERSFDEQRFGPMLTDAVAAAVSGPKIKKKLWNAIDQARKDTMNAGSGNATPEEFVSTWIDLAVAYLSENSMGAPELTIPQLEMTQLFLTLLQGNGLPPSLTAGADAPLTVVGEAVSAAYTQHTMAEGEWQPIPKKMRAMMGAMAGPGAWKGGFDGCKGGWGGDPWGKGGDPWGKGGDPWGKGGKGGWEMKGPFWGKGAW